MPNADFDKTMAEILAAATPYGPEAYPLCTHNQQGDLLEVILSPEAYWTTGPGTSGVLEHWSLEDNRLVGFTIYGVSKRKPKRP